MNCSYNGEFNITVEPASLAAFQAKLIIEDSSGIPSVITSATPGGDNRYGFVVKGPEGLSNPEPPLFEMRNSELSECGWNLTNSSEGLKEAGPWIGSPDIIIERYT
jgi:hypothetical protein